VVAPTFLKPNYAAFLSLEGFGTAAQKRVPSAARQAPALARLPSRRCASATRRNSCPRYVAAGASFRLRRGADAVPTSSGAAEAKRRSRSQTAQPESGQQARQFAPAPSPPMPPRRHCPPKKAKKFLEISEKMRNFSAPELSY
jgi:hypothetical protein